MIFADAVVTQATSGAALVGGLAVYVLTHFIIPWVKNKWFPDLPDVPPVTPDVPSTPSSHPVIDGFLAFLKNLMASKVTSTGKFESLDDAHAVVTEADVVREFSKKLSG